MKIATATALLAFLQGSLSAQSCLGIANPSQLYSAPSSKTYLRSSFVSANPLQLGDKSISLGIERSFSSPSRTSLKSLYASVPAVSGNEEPTSTSALIGGNYSLVLKNLCPTLETSYSFDTTSSFAMGGAVYYGTPLGLSGASIFGNVGYTRIANHVGSSSLGSNTSVYRAGIGVGFPKALSFEVSYFVRNLEGSEAETGPVLQPNQGTLAFSVTLRNSPRSKQPPVTRPPLIAEAPAVETKRDSVERRAALAFAELDSSIAARLPALTVPRTAISNPKAIAVVIGNRDYIRPEVPDVEYAVNDAEAMRAFLVRTFGFRPENVIFELNTPYVALQRLFGSQDDYKGRLFNLLAPDGQSDIFIFFSGHGAPDLGSGAPYIVPVDADPQSLRLTAYPLKQLYRNLALLPARSVTVVIDACFSGLSDKGVLLRGASPIGLRIDNPILAKENSVVFTASASNEVSGWLDQREHGLFTYSFLSVLSERFRTPRMGSAPTFIEIGSEVQQRVLSLSRRYRERDQTPQLFGVGSSLPLLFANP